MKKKIFCIIGPTGSGKSTILGAITEALYGNNVPYKKLIYNTTRKKRDNEVEGEDYHFCENDNEFYEFTCIDDIVEYREYNTVDNGKIVYYTTKKDFGDIDDTTPLFCAPSPDQTVAFINYASSINAEIYVIKIKTSTKERMIHLFNRCNSEEQALEALRRVQDEVEDFKSNNTVMKLYSTKYIEIENNYDGNIDEFINFITDCINIE